MTGRGRAWNPDEICEDAHELLQVVLMDINNMRLEAEVVDCNNWRVVDADVWLRLQCLAEYVVKGLLVPSKSSRIPVEV